MKKELFFSFLLTTGIFLLHISQRTMLLQDDTLWQMTYLLHQSDIPFKLRPFTNISLYALYEYTGLTVKQSFMLSQYTLLFFLFLSISYLFRQFGFDEKKRIIGLLITALTYPILCVHFIPNYTWDHLWLYIGLVWMLFFILKQRFVFASLVLLLTAIAHESALFASILFFFFKENRSSNVKWLVPALVPLVVYGLIRLFLFPSMMEGRFSHLSVNFADPDAVRQTFFSLFLSFGWIWGLFVHAALRNSKNHMLPQQERRLLYASLALVIVTCISILVVGKARETRLFYLPFITLIPFTLFRLESFFQSVQKNFREKRRLSIFLILLLFSLTIVGTVYLFPSFSFLPIIDFHRVLFAANLTVIFLVMLMNLWQKSVR